MNYNTCDLNSKVEHIKESLGTGAFTSYYEVYPLHIPDHIIEKFKSPILGVSYEDFKTKALRVVGVEAIDINSKYVEDRLLKSFKDDYNLTVEFKDNNKNIMV